MDCTDWQVFRNSVDGYTKAVTSSNRVNYNDKHWFTAKLRQLRLHKEEFLTGTGLERVKVQV